MDQEQNVKTLKVKITDVKIDKSCVQVIVQNVESAKYRELTLLKSAYMASNDQIFEENITLGETYIAKINFDIYARSRVVELKKFSGIAQVDLVDYGYSTKVGFHQLRKLPVSLNLTVIPPICKEYILAGVITRTKSDDFPQKFTKLYDLVVNKEFDMAILDKNEAGIYVDLRSLEASLAIDIIPNHPTLKLILKRIDLALQKSLMLEQYLSEKVGHEFDLTSTRSRRSSPFTLEHEYYEVVISFYENGPEKFYVQLVSSLQEYQKFHLNLQKISLKALKDPPKESEIYLADLEPNNVHRVEVIKINIDKTIHVRTIDQGFERIVKSSNLYQIPEDVRSIEPFVWKFSLHDWEKLNHISSLELNFFFQYITNDKRLKLHPTTTESNELDVVWRCKLKDKSQDVFDLLREYNPRNLKYQPQIIIANTHLVRTGYVESPQLFFIRLCKDDCTNDFFTQFEAFNSCTYRNPSVGSACCVKIKNIKFRGRIDKIITSTISRVNLIDVGISDDFGSDEIKVMVDKFTQIRPLAYKCCLVEFKNLDITDMETSIDIIKKFKALCQHHEKLLMTVESFENDCYYVTLRLKDTDMNIADKLLSNNSQSCFAGKSKLMDSIPLYISNDWTREERKESGEQDTWEESIDEIVIDEKEYTSSGKISSIVTPNDFTIQCAELKESLEEMLSEIQKVAESESPLIDFTKDVSCLAKNSFTNQWCRCTIMDADHSDEKLFVTLRDIDSGGFFSVNDPDHLKKIPVTFLIKTPFGIPCSLPIKMKRNKEEEATNIFLNYYNKEIRYKIIAANEYINTCDILCDGKNIAEELVRTGLVTKLKILQNGPVYIVHIENLLEFYVQLDQDTILIELLKTRVHLYEQRPLIAPVISMLVMAKSRTFGGWYRAQIVSFENENEIEVKFIDFGSKEKLSKLELGLMYENWFSKTPPLAHLCSLKVPKTHDANSKKAIERFKEMANNGLQKFTIRMIEPKTKRSIVGIYDENETDILNELLLLCNPRIEDDSITTTIVESSDECSETSSSSNV